MSRVARTLGSHPWLSGLLLTFVAVVGAASWYVWDELDVPTVDVQYIVPAAPRLAASDPSETVLRIHPARSSVTYEVEEHLAGTTSTATGTTNGIAGDLVLDTDDPAASQAGQIVVNVEQLHSDQELRDNRIRHDFLESTEHPLATFEPGTIEGLPAELTEDEELDVVIPGELTVKETTAPVELTGTATWTDGEVHLVATTEVQLSTFDAGPIELIGFVSTSDDVTLTFDVTFVDPTEVDIPTSVPAPGEEEMASGEGPSFEAAVMPVLAERCASCHNDGGAGSDVWRLDTAGDAAEVADGLGLVVGSGYMPPWPASEASVPFAHDPSLSAEQIDDVVAWARAGGELDVDPDTPIDAPPPADPVQPDLELTMPEPYVGTTDVSNDYRCFLLDPELTETTWVSAYQFVPDRTEVVHHALAFRVPAAERPKLESADTATDGTGWQCYAGTGVGDVSGLRGGNGGTAQFMAWAPGQDPTRFPDGSAMRLEPGDVVVLQVHYHFVHETPADQSMMRFELAPPGDDPVDVSYRTYLAPAEIPCRAGLEEGGLCDRGAAVADLATRYGRAAAFIPDALNRACGASAADAAEMTDGFASASCDLRIPSDSEAIAIFGHMHEIGDSFRMTLNPGTDDEQVLLDIPEWDFGWQLNYEPEDPVELSEGDVLRIECTWDRGRLPKPENRYITWAEGTEDEMCYSALTTVPR